MTLWPPNRAEHTDAVAESSGTCVSSSLCGVGAWASNCWAHMGVLPKRYCMEMDVPAAQASASARTEATGRRRTRAGCDSRWCGWSERHRETASKYLAFSSYASSVGTPSSASHDVRQSPNGHRWLSDGFRKPKANPYRLLRTTAALWVRCSKRAEPESTTGTLRMRTVATGGLSESLTTVQD